jgi:hypothetical protein
MQPVEKIPKLIIDLYGIVAELENLFPGRHFTLDGHLIGSIGEVLAAYQYDIDLFYASRETHDGKTRDGKQVQIKATQRNQVGLRSKPDYLLVLQINSNGTSEEIFNGPGELAWNNVGKPQKNGQRSISVAKLRKLSETIQGSDRVPKRYY